MAHGEELQDDAVPDEHPDEKQLHEELEPGGQALPVVEEAHDGQDSPCGQENDHLAFEDHIGKEGTAEGQNDPGAAEQGCAPLVNLPLGRQIHDVQFFGQKLHKRGQQHAQGERKEKDVKPSPHAVEKVEAYSRDEDDDKDGQCQKPQELQKGVGFVFEREHVL